jgi:hypothetical protein
MYVPFAPAAPEDLDNYITMKKTDLVVIVSCSSVNQAVMSDISGRARMQIQDTPSRSSEKLLDGDKEEIRT